MSSISLFQTNQSLPLTQQNDNNNNNNPNQEQCSTIRRRLSSVSLKNMSEYSSPAKSWAYSRSKSVSDMGQHAGSSIVQWWGWGWDWILSKKLPFAVDLEMSDEERGAIGFQNKGSWRHVFFKIKKIMGGATADKYDSVSSYFKNFDNKRNTLPQ